VTPSWSTTSFLPSAAGFIVLAHLLDDLLEGLNLGDLLEAELLQVGGQAVHQPPPVAVQGGESFRVAPGLRVLFHHFVVALLNATSQAASPAITSARIRIAVPICLSPPLSSINLARMSSRIVYSSGVNVPLALRRVIVASPCLKAFWFAGGPGFPRIPAIGPIA